MNRKTGQSAIAPEIEFILDTVSVYATGDRPGRALNAIARDLNWQLVVRMAGWHAVTPLLNTVLREFPESVPAAILDDLRRRYNVNAVRNKYLANELVRLAARFHEHDIPVMAFKGPVLAQIAYGDLGMREFVDLDILVRPSDMSRVRALLASMSYESQYRALDEVWRDFFQSCEEAFVNAERPGCIDVHWQMNPNYFAFAPEGDDLWNRMTAVELEGAAINTLSTPDLLMHLCVHGAKHGWALLGPICDIAMVIHHNPGLDWRGLVDTAESYRGRRLLMLGLYLAHQILGATIPEETLSIARKDAKVLRLAREVQRRMFSTTEGRAGIYQEWMVPTGALETAGDRCRYLIGRALSPRFEDWEFFRLPRPLFPLYYLLRPIRLAVAQGPRVIRDLFRRPSAPYSTDSQV